MRRFSNRRLLLSLCTALALLVAAGNLPAWAAGKVTVDKTKTVEMKATYEGTATSYTGRGSDAYSVGYYVQDGKIIAKNSLLADKDAAASSFKLDLVAEGEGFDAIIANGKDSNITVTGTVTATDEGDGKNASDFSALGTMFLAHDYAHITVEDMKIFTDGFVRAAFIADDHGSVMVKNTTVKAMGANPLTEAFDGYVNSADQTIMMSPPWVLGIQGAIRGGNMLGDNTTMSVIDSSITVASWAVLSTDACNNPKMNIVDTDMIVLPEAEGGMSSGNFSYSSNYGTGYGTYLIGGAKQDFYGANIKGLTYAAIAANGENVATYKSSNGSIALSDADGKAIETVTGKGKPTTIEAVFGFMTHGDATFNVLDGTVVNTEEATFLYKAGNVKLNLDGAKVAPKSGIILQMIDNDDSSVGMGDMTHMAFNTEFNETAGWPSENGSVTKPSAAGGGQMGGPGGGAPGGDMAGGRGGAPGGDMAQGGGMPSGAGGPGGPGGAPGGDMAGGPGGPGGDMAQGGGMPGGAGGPGGGAMGGASSSGMTITLLNGDYKGDLLNGGGYYTQTGASMDATIGKGASLTGAISLTETRHIDENGKQNLHFTINEYYYLGHVENRNYRNETAKINVALKDGGVWTVTGESLLSKLTVEKGAIKGAGGKTVVMTVDGKDTKIKEGKTYEGDIVISLK